MGKVLIMGASGTAGAAVAASLIVAGHDVTACVRPNSVTPHGLQRIEANDVLSSACEHIRSGEFDAVVSCLASRTGTPSDAWAIDHDAQQALLGAAVGNTAHFVLMSAICVQKPKLSFQHAKLAFEASLIQSGLRYSIIRPTAFFKSLSGQVERVRSGKPFLLFGDGRLTACKPISDRDLATFTAQCLTNETHWNAVLPIGGPGPAMTPRDLGNALFKLLGREAQYRSVPPVLLSGIASALSLPGKFISPIATKAELARIGHYYATESMLVWDQDAQRYNADATPEFGHDTLVEHFAQLLDGSVTTELGAHRVF